jgi:Domain of unknown function (DUF4194)
MAEFSQALARLIQEERSGGKDFTEIAARLANDGAIVSGDSKLETELYDAAAQVADEVSDYFGILGCTLYHNPKLGYFRLFPPAAKSPSVAQFAGATEGENESVGAGLRRRGNPHVSAALLAIRAIYQQKIASGDLSSGFGEVSTSVEEIYVTMQTRLKREPAQNAPDRRNAFRELANIWRVIRIPVEADPEDRETRITIRPMIADLINESVALRAEEDAAEIPADGDPDEAE